MDIQKDYLSREAFEEFEFQKRPFASKKVLFQKYDPERIGDCDGNEGKYYCTEMQEKWEIWQHIESQAIPQGFVLVPVKEIKTWYLNENESMYFEDPEWLCDTPVGEVVEVERRVSYELEQDPVFAAIQWGEVNGDVGYYETFKSREEAEKVAAHCKAMIEAAEDSQ